MKKLPARCGLTHDELLPQELGRMRGKPDIGEIPVYRRTGHDDGAQPVRLGTPSRLAGVKKLPVTLRVAVVWWAVLALVLLGFGIASWGNSRLLAGGSRSGLVALALLLALLAVGVGYGAWRLLRGQLAGRAWLTTMGLIGGIPLVLRGPRLGVLGATLLIGVVLLWLPQSMAYFKEQSRAARATRQAERRAAKGLPRR